MAGCEAVAGVAKTAPVLVTGSAGFVGKNLVASLKAQGWQNLLLFDVDSPPQLLEQFAGQAAAVFHLAGVNRPQNESEFKTGNADLTARLTAALQAAQNPAPLLLTSSTQVGYGGAYAHSKQAAEQAVLAHGRQNHSPVFVYRLPGLFGKWSRPAYNTVVATFCHNIARGLPIQVSDPAHTLPLCYIDDVVTAFMRQMGFEAPGEGSSRAIAGDEPYLTVDPCATVSLGQLADTLQGFAQNRQTLQLPNMANGFEKKLYATYLSFLPEDGFAYDLKQNTDARGSFTEFVRTPERGQFSVNVAKPGVTKGNHWHHTKNEKFLVVAGSAVIRFRPVLGGAVVEYAVSGEQLRVVDIPPGYTHNIQNVGHQDLVTLMWASEPFDPDNPDTYYEEV